MDIHRPFEQTDDVSPTFTSRWLWPAVVGLSLILAGGWFFLSQTSVGSSVTNDAVISLEPAPVAGHPAPDFALKDLNGDTIRLSDYQGKAVIVNFWATWCPPCRAEFPDLQKVAVENKDNLVIIGVNFTANDTPALVPGFVEEYGITFPIVLDETGEVVKTYGVLGLPTSVFIDKNGIVKEVFTGKPFLQEAARKVLDV